MKKIFLWMTWSLLTLHFAMAQNAYYDARLIRDSLGAKKKFGLAYLPLFKKYFPGKNDNQVATALATNPFLKDHFDPTSSASAGSFIGAQLNKAVSSAGNLNVANIADGFARFLIERGKEELNVAFFNRLKTVLETEECTTLLPETAALLLNIESYQYAEFIESLREAFRKDVDNLLVNLNHLIDLPKYKALLAELPEVRLAIRSANIVSELSQAETGILPDSLITQLAQLNEWEQIHPNLGNSWKLLDVLSQSIRFVPKTPFANGEIPRRWVPLSDLNKLIQDPLGLKLYLGIVYEQVGDIRFIYKTTSRTVKDYLDSNATRLLMLGDLIGNFSLLANEVDKTIEDLQNKRREHSLTSDDYHNYISKAINITEYGFKVARFIKPEIDGDPYIDIARNGNELYKHIYTKKYSNAIMSTFNILKIVLNERKKLQQKKIDENRVSNTAALEAAVEDPKLPKPKVVESFLKYGNFLASLTKAQNAEEVQKIIEAAALPAGSYSIKQRSSINVSFNGYIGYAWDLEGGDVYARGIYAPIGFAASVGLSKKHGGALSIFASLLDVGSIASYRLQNGATDSLKQEVRLESIFSPSAQLMFEVFKTPFVVCAGWKRTPKLFYSKQNGFTTFSPRNVFNISLLIDIPIFNIVNRPFAK